MLNEEGGIDPLEFRFYAMVDRVNTTGTTWLGLTVGCAQCHTHKYDPIPQQDYYRLMAFLNNADEPEMDVPSGEVAAAPRRYPDADRGGRAESGRAVSPRGGISLAHAVARERRVGRRAQTEVLDDGSVRISGTDPEQDTYTLMIDTGAAEISALRLEAIVDPQLPKHGPGPHAARQLCAHRDFCRGRARRSGGRARKNRDGRRRGRFCAGRLPTPARHRR